MHLDFSRCSYFKFNKGNIMVSKSMQSVGPLSNKTFNHVVDDFLQITFIANIFSQSLLHFTYFFTGVDCS